MLNTSYSTLLKLFLAGLALAILSMFFLDRTVYNIIHPAFIDQQELWEKITYIGDSEWMAIVTLLAIAGGLLFSFVRPGPVWSKMWRSGVFVFINVAVVGTSALILKNIVGRARPYLFDTEGPLAFAPLSFEHVYTSFPSGHTTTAFAFAASLTILYPRLGIPAFAIAILAGFSRLAVDAHYLGDVIFGATFGTICTIAVAKLIAAKFKI